MPSRPQLANAIRALSMDAVQRANSGHPGAPMGMADIAQVLWCDYLQHNPEDPKWLNRDRFVLSNGHGSMLLYSLLHLTGYALEMQDLKNFRQLDSKTPGHPELGYTPGVETTTGPLGQGFANAVGMAIAEKILAGQFNRTNDEEELDIVNHRTWVFAGDGCLMEGVSHEAASLAGTLGLGKLICIYDDNGISIDGPISGWFSDDTAGRFEAYNWQVIRDVDGHDADQVAAAIELAKSVTDKPSLICCKTIIGYGSPQKSGTAAAHGSPLGEDEIEATRQSLQWGYPPFEIPQEIYTAWDCKGKGRQLQQAWQAKFDRYRKNWPELATELERRVRGDLPANWKEVVHAHIAAQQVGAEVIASRKASQQTITALATSLPELIGGSADLTGSNLTDWPGATALSRDGATANYIYYGVREFGMSAITNGIALHGGFIPFSGTFLVFMEYARNAVRMAAIMGLRNVFVYTHDSIGQGEDGPTHQPIEQLTNLRTTPNLCTWRPADSTEAAVAWMQAIERRQGPTALVFSRQNVGHFQRTAEQIESIERGCYTLLDCKEAPDAVVIATGSEVGVAYTAVAELQSRGYAVRLVSMVCTSAFESASQEYQDSVLPKGVARLAVEAAHPDYWYKWVGTDGAVLGIDHFGESAPGGVLMKKFGFTAERIAEEVVKLIERFGL